MHKVLIVVMASLFLAGCGTQNKKIEVVTNDPKSIISTDVSESVDKRSDPLELFLIELTKETKIAFDNPVKADIFWNEGNDQKTLKTFYGDSFLITHLNSTLEYEKVVADYLVVEGFTQMGYNGSIGESSRKMGYRKGDMICKTDYSIYPEEETPHLIVYCTDATKGTLRK